MGNGMADEALRLEGIYLAFDNGSTLFEDFNLKVLRGEHVVINGPSGSGKTTLLKLCLGFIMPDEGQIFIDGIPLNEKTVWTLRLKIGYCPQEPVLGDGTVEDFLKRPFSYKANEKIIYSKEEAIGLLSLLGLEQNVLKRHVSALSGGEKQRICIVSALLLRRDIYFFDEPTSALDLESKKKLLKLFSRLSEKTIVYVSHDPDMLNSAQRVISLP